MAKRVTVDHMRETAQRMLSWKAIYGKRSTAQGRIGSRSSAEWHSAARQTAAASSEMVRAQRELASQRTKLGRTHVVTRFTGNRAPMGGRTANHRPGLAPGAPPAGTPARPRVVSAPAGSMATMRGQLSHAADNRRWAARASIDRDHNRAAVLGNKAEQAHTAARATGAQIARATGVPTPLAYTGNRARMTATTPRHPGNDVFRFGNLDHRDAQRNAALKAEIAQRDTQVAAQQRNSPRAQAAARARVAISAHRSDARDLAHYRGAAETARTSKAANRHELRREANRFQQLEDTSRANRHYAMQDARRAGISHIVLGATGKRAPMGGRTANHPGNAAFAVGNAAHAVRAALGTKSNAAVVAQINQTQRGSARQPGEDTSPARQAAARDIGRRVAGHENGGNAMQADRARAELNRLPHREKAHATHEYHHQMARAAGNPEVAAMHERRAGNLASHPALLADAKANGGDVRAHAGGSGGAAMASAAPRSKASFGDGSAPRGSQLATAHAAAVRDQNTAAAKGDHEGAAMHGSRVAQLAAARGGTRVNAPPVTTTGNALSRDAMVHERRAGRANAIMKRAEARDAARRQAATGNPDMPPGVRAGSMAHAIAAQTARKYGAVHAGVVKTQAEGSGFVGKSESRNLSNTERRQNKNWNVKQLNQRLAVSNATSMHEQKRAGLTPPAHQQSVFKSQMRDGGLRQVLVANRGKTRAPFVNADAQRAGALAGSRAKSTVAGLPGHAPTAHGPTAQVANPVSGRQLAGLKATGFRASGAATAKHPGNAAFAAGHVANIRSTHSRVSSTAYGVNAARKNEALARPEGHGGSVADAERRHASARTMLNYTKSLQSGSARHVVGKGGRTLHDPRNGRFTSGRTR